MATQIAVQRRLRAYQGTSPPAPSTPWREADFCVIDLETTGLDPARDEIIAFAALRIAGGRLRLGRVRYQLVRPRRMPGADTIRIHGLRAGDLVDAPALSDVLDELLEALTGKALVAHVAAVEGRFLDAALRQHGARLLNPIVDTAALAAELLRQRDQPVPDSIALSTLARILGLPIHRPHHADGDALTTAQIFLALAAHLDALEPQTVGSLQRCSNQLPSPHARTLLRRVLARLTMR